MKILQVLVGGAWGGGSVIVRSVVRTLVERGDEVWLVAQDDRTAREFSAVGARIVRLPFWYRPINPLDVIPFAQLYRLCRRERFDLVATHTSKGGVLGRIAARLAGAPYIVHHAHGFAFRDWQVPWVRRMYIAFEKIATRFCDCIICVSEEHRRGGFAAGVGDEKLVQTVLNGIDIERFRNIDPIAARRQLGFPEGDLLIGVGSRLAPMKGIEYLVRAMPTVFAQYPSARLVIYGEGPLRSELEEEAKRIPGGDRIHFGGFQTDLPERLSAFDVLVQPSLSEGLSISVLESMAVGKPLVVCDIQGNREVVDHMVSGLRVPPADPEALGSALVRLLSDRELAARLGAAGARTVRQRFTQQRMIRETLAVYDRPVATKVANPSDREPASLGSALRKRRA